MFSLDVLHEVVLIGYHIGQDNTYIVIVTILSAVRLDMLLFI